VRWLCQPGPQLSLGTGEHSREHRPGYACSGAASTAWTTGCTGGGATGWMMGWMGWMMGWMMGCCSSKPREQQYQHCWFVSVCFALWDCSKGCLRRCSGDTAASVSMERRFEEGRLYGGELTIGGLQVSVEGPHIALQMPGEACADWGAGEGAAATSETRAGRRNSMVGKFLWSWDAGRHSWSRRRRATYIYLVYALNTHNLVNLGCGSQRGREFGTSPLITERSYPLIYSKACSTN
jgi:hypothetical protein